MLGYLLVGTLIGPHALNLVAMLFRRAASGRVRRRLPDVLDRPRVFAGQAAAMKRIVFGLGLLQVLLTAARGDRCSAWSSACPGRPAWRSAALAMSSTAVLTKLLSERLELDAPHGREVMGVLLFQDLAVVPLLMMIPSFSQVAGSRWR
jgi:CPA2 family monovalent cation:H+ antiporter-2